MTPDRTGVKMIAMGKNLIRNIAAAAVLLALSAIARAQDAPESRAKEYAERYNLLVSRLGDDGVGVETVLNNWAAVAPDDIDMLTGRFRYYFAKSQRTEVVSKDQGRFMGAGPVLSLKDSTGNMESGISNLISISLPPSTRSEAMPIFTMKNTGN